MNHLLREDRRRREIDIDIYMGRDNWLALPGWEPREPDADLQVKARGRTPPKRRSIGRNPRQQNSKPAK
jgi:hypothetical protein